MGHPVCAAASEKPVLRGNGKQEQQKTQIPYGDNNQKGQEQPKGQERQKK
jgi:hypothetical protein